VKACTHPDVQGKALVMGARIAGQLDVWPTKEQMVAILRAGGLQVLVGRYALRVQDCSHFVFQQYGGDISDPVVDAYADTVAEMIREGKRVSDALSRAGVEHRFEIYDDNDTLVGYLHHEWPLQEEGTT
jgi:hypothetical protein